MSKGLIVLDPGHGKNGNQHTTNPAYYEGTQNYVLAGFLRDELISRGYDVMLTRNTIDENPSLEERGQLAGKNGALMFLSIHSNAPGAATTPDKYPTIRGAETFYSVTDERINLQIAKKLNEVVCRVMNTTDRGIKVRRYPDHEDWDFYGVLRAASQSGCRQAFLIEHGFHTNPEDSLFLQNSECLSKLACAEAEVIDECFG